LLYPDRITLLNSRKSYAMNTTYKFYNYKVDIKDLSTRVYVDHKLVIKGDLSFQKGSSVENRVSFGVHSDSSRGRALWKEVKAKSSPGNAGLYDAMITVRYR